MRIGFDAKRAFLNDTGLGNYSRDAIRVLSHFYTDNKYFLHTPKEKENSRLDFLDNRTNTFVRTPQSLLNKTLKSYWRSKSIVRDLFPNKLDINHGLSHNLPLEIKKPIIKTVGNTMKNSVSMFRQNKNTIKNLAYGFQEKYLKTSHNFGNKSVKYLGGEAIKKFKYMEP